MNAFESSVLMTCMLVAASAQAQPCSQPPVTCPPTMSLQTWVHNNLKPSGNACAFEMRTVNDLELKTGDNVTWTFCNACDVDMTVQLDTTGPGPFGLDTFEYFLPSPTADNLVSIVVPCHSSRSIGAYRAKAEGDWKYSMRSALAGAADFPDVIDPRLEIDDTSFTLLLQRLWLLLVGLVGGALLARRRRVKS